MPTTIVIDGVTLTLKKYPEFAAGNPTATDITLFSDPINGDLFKTTMDNLIANILNVDGVTITGDGSSGNPLVGSGIASITADNGLTANTATNVQLGGLVGSPATLLHNSYINADTFYLQMTGTAAYTLRIINTGTNYGLHATSDNGTGVFGNGGTGGTGGLFSSTDGLALNTQDISTSTNTVTQGIRIDKLSTGTPANGIGTSVDFQISTADSTNQISNQIISKWIDAADVSRTSEAKLKGVFSASTVDLMTWNADGSWQIRPITATAASAITPAEGMMLFASTTDATFTTIGFWGYRNGAWAAF